MLSYINHSSIKLAKLLLKQPSVSPKDAGCQKILAEKLIELNFTIDCWNEKGTSNLLAIKDKGPPYFLFSAHTDVVTPGELSLWKHHPFQPIIIGDKLYGRGIVDMKGSIAAFISAIESFQHTKGSIILAITSDEQGVANYGTKKIVEKIIKQNMSVDYCLIGAATSNNTIADCIKIGRRGSLNGFVSIQGKLGHVAYSEYTVLHEIDNLIKLLKDINLAKNDSNIDFNLTYINSGDGTTNLIPGSVDLQFNFRYPSSINYLYIIDKTQTLMENLKLDYKINWTNGAEPYICNKDEFAKKITHLLKDKFNIKSIINTTGGTSDGRFLNKLNCQIAELGLCTNKINQINEYADIKDIVKLSQIYKEILNVILQ